MQISIHNMKKLFFLVVLFYSALPVYSQKGRSQPPNVIIIFMDDMGYGDLESYGAVGYQTPNLNRLAAEGMRFTNFYTPQAVCTASRAALLTGAYPNRINMFAALQPNRGIGLNPNEETIAELLKSAGYKTAMVGKWHLGSEKEFLPVNQGFDSYYGLPYSNDMWRVDYDGKPVGADRPAFKNQPPLPLLSARSGQQNVDTVKIIKTLADQSELTTAYTEQAVDFIHKNSKNPFFLYLAHSMTHVPLGVSSKFKGKSELGLFGDVMMEVDWSTGELMKTLRELKIENNTLVIFTSDNGPWLNFGNHAGSTAGLKEGKGTSWEGGTRVPCIMKLPKVIAPGTVTNRLSSTIDILPTLANLAHAKLPVNKIDGVNIISVLKGEDKNPRNELIYYYNKNDLEAVRIGWWKLVFPHAYRSYEDAKPGKDGFPGSLNRVKLDDLALYDLRRDPGERYNVIADNPDKVEELQQLARRTRLDLGDDLTNVEGKNRRPIGTLEK